MATITVMKNYVMKKAQGSSDENLKKIAKILKNYSKLDVATKKKVSIATEKLYTNLKAKESKSSTPKKSASAPKKSGTKKKIATQDLKSLIAKFKAKVGNKVWKQATSGTTIKQDAERPALPKGKRISRTGRVYWENRANRTDVKQPPKTFPRLAKGGQVGSIIREENELMGYEPYFEKNVTIATIDESKKIVRPTHGYYPNHPLSKKAISWAKRNGYEYIADGKKFAEGGSVNEGREKRWLLIFEDEEGYAVKSSVIARTEKEAEEEARYQEELGDDWKLDSIKSTGYFAKGGITEHGLKVGDKIKSGKVIGTTILVEDSNGEYARVDLNKGIRTKVQWDSKTKKYIDKK